MNAYVNLVIHGHSRSTQHFKYLMNNLVVFVVNLYLSDGA